MDLFHHDRTLFVLHEAIIGGHLLILLILLVEDLSDHGSQGVHQEGLEVFVGFTGSEAPRTLSLL